MQPLLHAATAPDARGRSLCCTWSQAESALPKGTGPREPTKNEKARQYALQLPRPRLREPAVAAADPADAEGLSGEADMDEGELLLARLERQHEEQQLQAKAIRQELGLHHY